MTDPRNFWRVLTTRNTFGVERLGFQQIICDHCFDPARERKLALLALNWDRPSHDPERCARCGTRASIFFGTSSVNVTARRFPTIPDVVREAMLTQYHIVRLDTTRYDLDRCQVAKHFAQQWGYEGRPGGWVYARNGRPVCQGWLAFYYQYHSRIIQALRASVQETALDSTAITV